MAASSTDLSYTIAPMVDGIRQDPCGEIDVHLAPTTNGFVLPVVCDAIVTTTPGLHTVGFRITYATSGTSVHWFVKGSAFVSAPTALILIEDLI
jgi:hypothetical protein